MFHADSRGVIVAKHVDNATIIKRIRKELTVTPLSPNDPFPKKIRMFIETPTSFVVPQYWAHAHDAGDAIRIRDTRPDVPKWKHEFVGELRTELHQFEAVSAVLKSIRTTGGAILNLHVGSGKTTCALYIAATLGLKTGILVHKQFLADQFTERISQHLPGATVSTVRGDECDTSGDFVLLSIQTLMSRKYPPSTFENIGFLIVDECHHIVSSVFSTVIFGGLSTRYTLGLSATISRKDGLGHVIPWFLGPVAYTRSHTDRRDVTVRIVNFKDPSYTEPPKLNRRGDICYASLISQIVDVPARNGVLVDEITRLVDVGRRVLVLSHRRGHADILAKTARAKGIDAATYLGGDKEAPEALVTCATYALASEGYDDPRLTALVLATPSSDVTQACGRVMRGSGTGAIIVDVVDHYSVLYPQFVKRRKQYRDAGFSFGDGGASANDGNGNGNGKSRHLGSIQGPEDTYAGRTLQSSALPLSYSEKCMFEDDE